jgi:glycerol kinase
MAGLGVGLWKNFDELKACWHLEKEWKPKIKAQQRQKLVGADVFCLYITH